MQNFAKHSKNAVAGLAAVLVMGGGLSYFQVVVI